MTPHGNHPRITTLNFSNFDSKVGFFQNLMFLAYISILSQFSCVDVSRPIWTSQFDVSTSKFLGDEIPIITLWIPPGSPADHYVKFFKFWLQNQYFCKNHHFKHVFFTNPRGILKEIWLKKLFLRKIKIWPDIEFYGSVL